MQCIATKVRQRKVSLFLIMQKDRDKTDKLVSQMTTEKLPYFYVTKAMYVFITLSFKKKKEKKQT